MIIAGVVATWFMCGLLAVHLAFEAAVCGPESFDPVHVWLAILGPVGLAFACVTFVESKAGGRSGS